MRVRNYLLCLLSLIFMAWPAVAETLHFSSDESSAYPRLNWVEARGQVRVFFQDWALEADEMQWSEEQAILELRGHVAAFGSQYKLKAEMLRIHLPTQTLTLHTAQIDYQQFRFLARSAQLRPQLLQLKSVRLSHPDWPGVVQAEQVHIYPELVRDNVIIQSLVWQGVPWPKLVLSLNPPQNALQIRPQNQVLIPALNFENGGLVSDNLLRLFDSASGQLFSRLRWHPEQGWGTGLLYEWRPEKLGLLTGSLLWGHAGGQGNQQWLLPLANWGWLQTGLHWNEPLQIYPQLQLPLRQSETAPVGWGGKLVLHSNWMDWGPLQARLIQGLALGGQPNILWGNSLQLMRPLGLEHGLTLYPSLLIYAELPAFQGVIGGRLLLEHSPAQWPLTWGHYLEAYATTLTASRFQVPQQLAPRLGHYLFWNWHADLATGLVWEWSPLGFQTAKLDGLITWRQPPVILNLWLQTLPPGLQLQTHFSFF